MILSFMPATVCGLLYLNVHLPVTGPSCELSKKPRTKVEQCQSLNKLGLKTTSVVNSSIETLKSIPETNIKAFCSALLKCLD